MAARAVLPWSKASTPFVAQIAEISAGDGDGPRVHKVWCAVDCGVAVNPDVIRAQMEGGIGYGLGHILFAGVPLDDGHVVPKNFDTYRSLRINEMPEIEVAIVQSSEKPTGVGEPGRASDWTRASPTPWRGWACNGRGSCRSSRGGRFDEASMGSGSVARGGSGDRHESLRRRADRAYCARERGHVAARLRVSMVSRTSAPARSRYFRKPARYSRARAA